MDMNWSAVPLKRNCDGLARSLRSESNERCIAVQILMPETFLLTHLSNCPDGATTSNNRGRNSGFAQYDNDTIIIPVDDNRCLKATGSYSPPRTTTNVLGLSHSSQGCRTNLRQLSRSAQPGQKCPTQPRTLTVCPQARILSLARTEARTRMR